MTTHATQSIDNAPPPSTPFLFFTGKGGVGKTSVACATGVQCAESGLRTLIVSTDPASNLDDVFGIHAATAPTAVPDVERLWVMNIDPEQAAADYRERVVAPYRNVLPQAAVRSMEEQLSGACTVEIAAFNEFTALLAVPATTANFDRVIFDTAPTGHTLRLLTLPSAWTGFIETNETGASCLGPLAGLEQQRAQYSRAVAVLADPMRTTLVLVSRPDVASLREAARASEELSALGIGNQQLIVNGVLEGDGDDAVAAAYLARQRHALGDMPSSIARLPRRVIPLVSWELTGASALHAFADAKLSGIRTSATRSNAAAPPEPATRDRSDAARSTAAGHARPFALDWPDAAPLPGMDELVRELAASATGVVMTMGKGGVGKTTVAVAIALGLARAGRQVHLTTTDPAAHVEAALFDETHGARPDGLTVSRIDPAVETARYAAEVIAAAGNLDAADKALLEEDLRSPCTEEIAVFRAFARVVDEGQGRIVVLDTAPTGHTLLLLDAAESYHREVARTNGAAHIPDAVRALLPRLRDANYTRMLLVTLAEKTPIHEAERLQADLQRAGIEPFGWVVNASLAASGTSHPVLGERARLERPRLADVVSRTRRVWLLPWQLAGAETGERRSADQPAERRRG